MGRIQRWSGVQFGVTIEECRLNDDGSIRHVSGKVFDSLKGLISKCNPLRGVCLDIELLCESSGYYDPGKTYGPPERCYPPEGSDERKIVKAWLLVISDDEGIDIVRVNIPQDRLSALEDECYELIEKADLPDYDPSESDLDRWEDDY